MAWIIDKFGREQFDYSIRLLRSIAECYEEIYDGLDMGIYTETNPFRLAEYRADFCLALKQLTGRKKKIMELIIKGLENGELEQRGFYRPNQLRRRAFEAMKKYLNGGGE